MLNDNTSYCDATLGFTFGEELKNRAIDHHLFITNAGDDRIIVVDSKSTTDFAMPKYKGASYLLGTTSSQRVISRKLAGAFNNQQELMEALEWLHVGKVGCLSFDSDPEWHYTAVCSKCGNPVLHNSGDKIIAEFDVEFSTVGTYLPHQIVQLEPVDDTIDLFIPEVAAKATQGYFDLIGHVPAAPSEDEEDPVPNPSFTIECQDKNGTAVSSLYVYFEPKDIEITSAQNGVLSVDTAYGDVQREDSILKLTFAEPKFVYPVFRYNGRSGIFTYNGETLDAALRRGIVTAAQVNYPDNLWRWDKCSNYKWEIKEPKNVTFDKLEICYFKEALEA